MSGVVCTEVVCNAVQRMGAAATCLARASEAAASQKVTLRLLMCDAWRCPFLRAILTSVALVG